MTNFGTYYLIPFLKWIWSCFITTGLPGLNPTLISGNFNAGFSPLSLKEPPNPKKIDLDMVGLRGDGSYILLSGLRNFFSTSIRLSTESMFTENF